jgi:NADH:quinone reductase (non-electrogenic)
MGLIHDVPSTAELFDRIIRQAEAIRKKWAD